MLLQIPVTRGYKSHPKTALNTHKLYRTSSPVDGGRWARVGGGEQRVPTKIKGSGDIKVTFCLEQVMKAERGSRDIPVLFL